MTNALQLKVSSKGESYEGTVAMAGLKPTKLVKGDGGTVYKSRSAVTQSAQSLAKRLGMQLEVVEPLKKAAKKTVKSCLSLDRYM